MEGIVTGWQLWTGFGAESYNPAFDFCGLASYFSESSPLRLSPGSSRKCSRRSLSGAAVFHYCPWWVRETTYLIHASAGPSLHLYPVTHGGSTKERLLIKVLSSRRANWRNTSSICHQSCFYTQYKLLFLFTRHSVSIYYMPILFQVQSVQW